MTDPTLLPAPSQTSGPYLSIGLLREHIGSSLVRRRRPASDPDPRPAPRRQRRSGPGRHGRDLAGERGRPLRAPGGRAHGRSARGGVPRFRPLGDGGRRVVRVRDREAGSSAGPGRRAAGPAPRRPRVRPRAAQAARDAALLPRRGGGERPGPGPLRARRRRSARRSSRSPEDGGLRFDIRLQGDGETTFFAV